MNETAFKSMAAMIMDSTCIVLVLASCPTEIRVKKAANSKPKYLKHYVS